MNREEWRDIAGHPNYQVSNLGRVKSIQRRGTKGGVLKPEKHRDGYLLVDLFNGGEKRHFLIHRLVADAFIPNPENRREIDHIDGDKTNNSAANLRWATRTENNSNPNAYGGIPPKNIICIELDCSFASLMEAERVTGCPHQNISKAIAGKRKTAGGYHWKEA